MKRLYIIIGVMLTVLFSLLVILVILIVTKRTPTMLQPSSTTTLFPPTTPTAYPEYQLTPPIQTAPEEDPNAYDKLPKDQQEYSSLVVSLPINTNDYMVYFNFADSTFQVTVFTDKGMEDYRKLRQKYPNLKDSLFIVVDRRIELFKL